MSPLTRGGETLVFRVTLSTQGVVDLGALATDSEKEPTERPVPRRVSSKLTGTLSWQQEGLRVVGWLDGERLLLDGAESSEARALLQALRAPFHVTQSALGELQTVVFSPTAPQAARQLLKTLLSLLQCVRHRRETSRWDTAEDDLVGTIQARYRQVSGAVEKRVLSVQSAEASVGRATPGGTLRYVFDAHGLVKATGERTLQLTLEGKSFSRSAVQLQLQRLRIAPHSPLPAIPEALASSPERLSTRLSPAERTRAIHRSALGRETTQSLSAALTLAEQSPAKVNEGDLFVKLRALFVLQPTQAETFLPRLLTVPAESKSLRILTLALSAANTQEAQRTLVAAARQRLGEYSFTQAVLPTLVEQAQWTSEAETLVRELAERGDDTGKMAVFLVGSAVHTLALGEPERAERLLALLLSRLERARDADERRLALGALGNAGQRKTLPRLLPFLADSDPLTRAEAADALRLIVTDDTTERLCTLLRSDPEPLVRRQAALTLGFRPLTGRIKTALTAAQTQDAEESVRNAAKETLERGR